MIKKEIYLEKPKKKISFFKIFISFVLILWILIYLPPKFYPEIFKNLEIQTEYFIKESFIILGQILKANLSKFQDFFEKPIVGYYLFYQKLQENIFKINKILTGFFAKLSDSILRFKNKIFALFLDKIPKIEFPKIKISMPNFDLPKPDLPKPDLLKPKFLSKKFKEEKVEKDSFIEKISFVEFNKFKELPQINKEILISKVKESEFKEVFFSKNINKAENNLKDILKGQVVNENLINKDYKIVEKEDEQRNLDKIKLNNLPQVKAKSVLVKSISGKEIFVKNPGEILSLASLTKLMTALIAFDNFKEDDIFEIRKEDIEKEGDNGLVVGDKFSRDDLLKLMLLLSSNDAAYSFTQKIGEEKFVSLMNQKAKEIGMKNTLFVDPMGISTLNKSTVDDFYKFIVYLFENKKEILNITQIKETTVFSLNGNSYNIKNRIYKIEPEIFEKEFLGGKTGFLSESGFNFFGIFKNSEPIVFIILNDPVNYFSSFREIFDLINQI
jgi:D-alanyl-D-alanine carboxypeptidase (penicillin-binding protein 5/6)